MLLPEVCAGIGRGVVLVMAANARVHTSGVGDHKGTGQLAARQLRVYSGGKVDEPRGQFLFNDSRIRFRRTRFAAFARGILNNSVLAKIKIISSSVRPAAELLSTKCSNLSDGTSSSSTMEAFTRGLGSSRPFEA